jgi:hypothetical protein
MQNAFGNVIFTDEDGRYWRICPEELSCEIVAADDTEFANLQASESFSRDWSMQELVDRARSSLGDPVPERCYCLKIPGILGGKYAFENVDTIDRAELISVSGHIAQQIDDLPDGAQIKLTIVD